MSPKGKGRHHSSGEGRLGFPSLPHRKKKGILIRVKENVVGDGNFRVNAKTVVSRKKLSHPPKGGKKSRYSVRN